MKDQNIAHRIVKALAAVYPQGKVLEIGPGSGVLTQIIHTYRTWELFVNEIDYTLFEMLNKQFQLDEEHFLKGDFLHLPLKERIGNSFAIIGNFPYNISTQIVFKILENRKLIPFCVGMFQKEVAERIAAPPGSKTYGITSVLTQAYYSVEYLFTVPEHVFTPPPKVKSGVIRISRKIEPNLPNEKLFFTVVKAAFNQRRKTLKNALKNLFLQPSWEKLPWLDQRAEELSVEQFIELTQQIEKLNA